MNYRLELSRVRLKLCPILNRVFRLIRGTEIFHTSSKKTHPLRPTTVTRPYGVTPVVFWTIRRLIVPVQFTCFPCIRAHTFLFPHPSVWVFQRYGLTILLVPVRCDRVSVLALLSHNLAMRYRILTYFGQKQSNSGSS